MSKKPRVIIFVEGGVIHGIMSDSPVEFRVIDYDVEGSTDYKMIKLPGSGREEAAHISKFSLEGTENLDPFFQQEAIR